MTPYLIRLIRRAQGDAPGMMPVKRPGPGAVDDLLEEAEKEAVAMPQRPAAQTERSSPPVVQTGKPPISKGSKPNVVTAKLEQILKHIRHFEHPPADLEPHKDRPGHEIKKQDSDFPAQTNLTDHGPLEINEIHRDSARPDADERSKVLPDGIRNDSAKTIYNPHSETNFISIAVPDEARPHSHVTDDPVAPSRPAFRIENEPESPLRSKAHPVLKPTIESFSQPVWPLHPRRPPDPRQGGHQRQDNGTTVEIGSVIIETVKTSATPKRPAVRPHAQRRKRPGPMRSETRDNRRHQTSVSRLKYGLGAL